MWVSCPVKHVDAGVIYVICSGLVMLKVVEEIYLHQIEIFQAQN